MDRFGWTPRQIETLTDYEYEAIISTIETLSNIEKTNREKNEKKRTK